MLPELIHLGAELCMIGMRQQKLVEYFEAKLFWRGIQSLHDRDVSLLWQVDDASECQVQEVGGWESGLDTRKKEVLAATEVIQGSPRPECRAYLLGESLLHYQIKSNYNRRDQTTQY